MKRMLTILFFYLLISQVSNSQIPPFADQFLVNSFLTNPALAGTTRKAPINLSVRQQWMGLTQAPLYQTISYNKSMLEKGQRFNQRGFLNRGDNSTAKVGVGGGIFNINYGSVSEMGIHLDYAYHVYTDKGRLSFGLALLYQRLGLRTDDFIRSDPFDGNNLDNFLDDDISKLKDAIHILDASSGIHYYSSFWFAGASVINLFNSKARLPGNFMLNANNEPTYTNRFLAATAYAYGGISPSFGKNFSLKPSILLKYSGPAGLNVQGNVLFSLQENFETGLLYKYCLANKEQALGLFIGLRAYDVLIRYQFDYPLGTFLGPNRPTQLISVGYLL